VGERAVKERAIVIGVAIVALVLVMIVAIGVRSSSGSRGEVAAQRSASPRESASPATPTLADPKWATGQRITVEVLNATKVRGLARRAARALRDQGFDVVSTGTNHDQFDTTVVLDRTGHRDWASLAAKAMGGGTVLVRPDSSREVDLTVLIGSTWRAPSQPFYP
jgi:LytR cell envelope-related transcriptional attenuator